MPSNWGWLCYFPVILSCIQQVLTVELCERIFALTMEWLERVNGGYKGNVRGCEGPNVARPSSAAVPAPTQVAFPSELVDAIIDQIHLADQSSRRRALIACSLVSKSWLPRSRYHLFHTKLLWHRMEPWTFVALLHAPLSTITPYVRELRLHETWGRCTYGPWLNAALPRLTILSAITSLLVKGARFQVLETEDTTKFFGSFQMLRELSLVGCTFATSEQVIGVLGAIPSLEYLRLNGVDLSINVRLEAGRYPTPSRLHTLVFTDAFVMREILQWLVKDAPVPPIRTLELRVDQIEDLQPAADFLQALGPSVTNLTISDSSDSQECYGAYFFLSSTCHFIFLPHCATCRCIFSLR
jgi:hypothetical protein